MTYSCHAMSFPAPVALIRLPVLPIAMSPLDPFGLLAQQRHFLFTDNRRKILSSGVLCNKIYCKKKKKIN